MQAALATFREWIARGNAGAVVSCDGVGRPELCRIWGARAHPEETALEVFLLRTCAEQTLQNLAKNPRVAVTIVEPTTYRSIQFKGIAEVTRPVDIEYCARQLALFDQTLERVGMSAGTTLRMVEACEAGPAASGVERPSGEPRYVALLVTPHSIYDQTPKPGAGARLV